MWSVRIRSTSSSNPTGLTMNLNTCEFFSPLHRSLITSVFEHTHTLLTHLTHEISRCRTSYASLAESHRFSIVREHDKMAAKLQDIPRPSYAKTSCSSSYRCSSQAPRTNPGPPQRHIRRQNRHERSDVERSRRLKNSTSSGGRFRQRLGPSVRGFGGSTIITRRLTGRHRGSSRTRLAPLDAVPRDIRELVRNRFRARRIRSKSTGRPCSTKLLEAVAEAGVPGANFTTFAKRLPREPTSLRSRGDFPSIPELGDSFPRLILSWRSSFLPNVPDFYVKGRNIASANTAGRVAASRR